MPGEDWWILLDTQVTFVTDPINPCAGQQFSVTWQEVNGGTGPSQSYTTVFQLNGSEDSTQQETYDEPVQPGESVARTMWFTVPADTYNMNLWVDGTGVYLGNVIVANCSGGGDGSASSDESSYEQNVDEWAYSETYTDEGYVPQESQSEY